MRSVALRVRAATGEKDAIAELGKLRKRGDKQAIALHPTPAAMKALAQTAKMLREEGRYTGSGPPDADALLEEGSEEQE